MYHVPSLSTNLLLVSRLTQIDKIVEFWLDQLFVKDMKNDRLIVTEGLIDSKDQVYKVHDLAQLFPQRIALIAHIDVWSIIWHERPWHLNFLSLKLMVTQNMVVGLPKILTNDGVCRVFMKHQSPFDSRIS